MHPLYWAREPTKGPSATFHWSYSSLASWRACPFQWYLARAQYEGQIDRGYPLHPTAPAIQGLTVHAALEDFAASNRNAGSPYEDGIEPKTSFPIRAIIRRKFEETMARVERENPRGDLLTIRARVDLDECVNLFKRLAARLPRRSGIAGQKGEASDHQIPKGTEVWIEVDDPPISGRLDMVNNGAIVDFKTGDTSPYHAEQLIFYAALWWLKTGETPSSLEVVYARPPFTEVVPVPSLIELQQVRDGLKTEIDDANGTLAVGTPSPNPDAAICGRCHVRQLCDAYWVSPKTTTLRAQGLQSEGSETTGQRWWRDVYIDKLPSEWKLGSHCLGVAHAPNLGEIAIRIDRLKCPGIGDPRPSAARLIGAAVSRGRTGWELSTSKSTEVFWIP